MSATLYTSVRDNPQAKIQRECRPGVTDRAEVGQVRELRPEEAGLTLSAANITMIAFRLRSGQAPIISRHPRPEPVHKADNVRS